MYSDVTKSTTDKEMYDSEYRDLKVQIGSSLIQHLTASLCLITLRD